MQTYHVLKVGEQEYKLRLTGKTIESLEEKLGCSIFQAFQQLSTGEGKIVKTLVTFLHGSAQALEHDITMDKAYEIYDKLVDDGKTMEDVVQVVFEVLKISGFFSKSQLEAANKAAQKKTE